VTSTHYSIANTLWSIAQIKIAQEQWQDAYDLLERSYRINLALGRLDGICHVGLSLGQLLALAGHRDDARTILTRSLDGFLKLGQPQLAQDVQSILDLLG
jgi:hypothetical protein